MLLFRIVYHSFLCYRLHLALVIILLPLCKATLFSVYALDLHIFYGVLEIFWVMGIHLTFQSWTWQVSFVRTPCSFHLAGTSVSVSDWLIDWLVLNAVSAISQSFINETLRNWVTAWRHEFVIVRRCVCMLYGVFSVTCSHASVNVPHRTPYTICSILHPFSVFNKLLHAYWSGV